MTAPKYNREFVASSFGVHCWKCGEYTFWKLENPNTEGFQGAICSKCGAELFTGHLRLVKKTRKEMLEWRKAMERSCVTDSVKFNGKRVCAHCHTPLIKMYFPEGCEDCGAMCHYRCPQCERWDCGECEVGELIWHESGKYFTCTECSYDSREA